LRIGWLWRVLLVNFYSQRGKYRPAFEGAAVASLDDDDFDKFLGIVLEGWNGEAVVPWADYGEVFARGEWTS
jgi:hypothetical protein